MIASFILLLFSITSKTLPNKDITYTTEHAVKNLEKEEADTIHTKISFKLQKSNMSSRQLTHIKTDHPAKGFNFWITSKKLPSKDIIATIEDAVKDVEKKEADTIRAKISLTLENFKLLRINSPKTSVKFRKSYSLMHHCTFTRWLIFDLLLSLTRKTILINCLKRDPTTKIKGKPLIQLKSLKDKGFIDNKLNYYLKPTDYPTPTIYGRLKIHKPGAHIRPIVSYSGSSLFSLSKYIANILIL